ncbi:MAG: ribonuclease R [Parafilimonas sp.]
MKNKKSKSKSKHSGSQAFLLKGKLDIARNGLGYVVIADGSGDILVRPGNFSNALHGDTVRVKVFKENLGTGKKEGKITEVVSRLRTEFIGTIQLSTNYAFFIPDTDKPMPDVYIPLDKINGAKNKERVAVRLVKWAEDDKKPIGEVITVLDSEDENNMAMQEILSESGFPLSFSNDVIEESERLSPALSDKEIKKRKDFRDVLTFTIDPVDAKDFDDAISIKKIKKDVYEIGVHIADVSHFVAPETALDMEAYKRATSVYLPDRVNPMLPENISNVLCSLRPDEDKFTFSALFEMNVKGEVKQIWIGKTLIHSDYRFTYEDVQQIIESKEGKYAEEILLLNTIAQKMRQERFKNGAINFSSQEVRFKLDEKGKPISIVIKENKEAHQLVEECMLLANKKVAEYVSGIHVEKKSVPFPYRTHDEPDKEKLLPFVEFSRKFGHQFDMSSPEKITTSFNQLLKDVQGKPEQHVLEQLGIRTMAKAAYTTDNIGHYGLGFENYCHFTSPIRRYPDVLVHRIVESCLKEKPFIDKKMDEKCSHCSERERAAMEAERAANKYKQVEFMKEYLGEEFDAVISGVARLGFWAETVAHKCEGLVSINDLNDYDEFRLIEADYSLVGKRSGRKFRMGDNVRIKVVAANLDKRQLDYQWVQNGNNDNVVKPQKPPQKKSNKKTKQEKL